MGQEQESADTAAEEPSKAIIPGAQAHGAVIYADAGVRPVNPGFGGWGFHGYTYSNLAPKKSMGPANLGLTSTGYSPKAEKLTEVTPVHYVDAFGTIPHVSNNGAEVLAAAHAMDCVSRWGVQTVMIKTDSRYVITGAMEYLPRWKKNNWCKSDGTQVSNLEHWKTLDQYMTKLKSSGTQVTFQWVKGHNGDQGNEMADKYATIGALASGAGQDKVMTQIVEAESYWKTETEPHPLIAHRSMYFVTDPSSIVKGEYYLGNHGKADELLGKRMADGSYSYVQLDVADPYIELLLAKQLKISQTEDNVVLVRLDELFSAKNRKDLMIFGEDMFVATKVKRHKVQDLKMAGGSDDEPISMRLLPPMLAMRAVDAVNFLKGLFLAWKENRLEGVTATDITSTFYSDEKKGGKKIRSDFTSANSALAVVGNTPDPAVPTIDLELIINIDLPSRNVFKRIEKLEPKITLLVWKDSDKSYRYATILEAQGGKAIWCGYYTNFKYLF